MDMGVGHGLFPLIKGSKLSLYHQGRKSEALQMVFLGRILAENQLAPGSSPGGLGETLLALYHPQKRRVPLASVILEPDSLGTKRVLSPGSICPHPASPLSIAGAMSGAGSKHDGLDTSMFMN